MGKSSEPNKEKNSAPLVADKIDRDPDMPASSASPPGRANAVAGASDAVELDESIIATDRTSERDAREADALDEGREATPHTRAPEHNERDDSFFDDPFAGFFDDDGEENLVVEVFEHPRFSATGRSDVSASKMKFKGELPLSRRLLAELQEAFGEGVYTIIQRDPVTGYIARRRRVVIDAPNKKTVAPVAAPPPPLVTMAATVTPPTPPVSRVHDAIEKALAGKIDKFADELINTAPPTREVLPPAPVNPLHDLIAKRLERRDDAIDKIIDRLFAKSDGDGDGDGDGSAWGEVLRSPAVAQVGEVVINRFATLLGVRGQPQTESAPANEQTQATHTTPATPEQFNDFINSVVSHIETGELLDVRGAWFQTVARDTPDVTARWMPKFKSMPVAALMRSIAIENPYCEEVMQMSTAREWLENFQRTLNPPTENTNG